MVPTRHQIDPRVGPSWPKLVILYSLFNHFGATLDYLVRFLVALWVMLTIPGPILPSKGFPKSLSGRFWVDMGELVGTLRRLWRRFGAFWGHFRRTCGSLGGDLGVTLHIFGVFSDRFGRIRVTSTSL